MEAVAQGDHCAAVDAQAERPDRFRHLPAAVPPGRRVEAVQQRTYYIDPVESLLLGRPDRAFAQHGLGIEHASDFRQFPLPSYWRFFRAEQGGLYTLFRRRPRPRRITRALTIFLYGTFTDPNLR